MWIDVNFLPMNIKYTIYNSLFRSHIEFNLSCWGNSRNKDIDMITVLQKRAIRYIANLKYNSHTGNSFKKLNILKFSDLFTLNQASFMYRYVHNKLPPSFNNLFPKLSNFDRSLAFEVPKLSKASLKNFPSFAMVKVWNDLPLDIKRKKSLKTFKIYLSRSLTEFYDTVCNKVNCYSCRK